MSCCKTWEKAITERYIFRNLASEAENVFYANNAPRIEMIDSVVSTYDLEMVLFFLKNNKTEKIQFMKGIPSYIALGHTDLKADFLNIADFEIIYDYCSDRKKILPYEFGRFGDIRFFLTPYFSPYLLAGGLSNVLLSNGEEPARFDEFVRNDHKPKMINCDVYPVFFAGANSYCLGRGGDPVGGWKILLPKILNQNHIAVLDVGCSAYPGFNEFYE